MSLFRSARIAAHRVPPRLVSDLPLTRSASNTLEEPSGARRLKACRDKAGPMRRRVRFERVLARSMTYRRSSRFSSPSI